MKQWIWRQLVEAGFDTSKAIDLALSRIDELDEFEHRIVDRTGLARLVSDIAKSQRLNIPENGGPNEQMPLLAAVMDDGKWMRVSYLRANLAQLRKLHDREATRSGRATKRLARLRYDLDLFERHQDLPDLEAVWRSEGITYRLAKAA